MQQYFFTPGELIYREDLYDPGNSNALYLLTKGSVELVYADIRREGVEGVRIKKLNEGDSFNESAFFSNITDDFSVRAINYVTVYKVKRDDFY